MAIRIITTEDGSHSLYNEELNETYHSTKGARGESIHVFIKEGLTHYLNANQPAQLNILEVGLGTGLNALLTAEFAKENQILISMTSLEPFPIPRLIYENLNYGQLDEERKLFAKIHESDWEVEVDLDANFKLQKSQSSLENFTSTKTFEIIYFDAFAPSKQEEVWDIKNLQKCYELLSKGGILTTYCAQGKFKRNLEAVGFEVETLQGAMGKKEMVRARKS